MERIRRECGKNTERMRRMEQEKREEIEVFLKKAASLGVVPGLSNMEHLMAELGDIQETLSIVHIAGTNGKGSVGAMLESVLVETGCLVGRYSSPAVFSVEEQYQIGGVPIEEEERFLLLAQLRDACRNLEAKGLAHPTLFEIETAAAFLWFYQKKCKIVLLETGMGGRLDATNVIRKPLCSVITSISMDHMKFLGNTLSEIAAEKAGIIKHGCPAVSARQEPLALAVIKETCKNECSKLYYPQTEPDHVRYEKERLVFDWEKYNNLELSLLGAYQLENAVCALLALKCLEEEGFFPREEEEFFPREEKGSGHGDVFSKRPQLPLVSDEPGAVFSKGPQLPPVPGSLFSEAHIRRGLRNACWPGRFEVVSRAPLIVLDGAHNEDAAKKLRKTLELGFTNRKILYIIGVLADKEHEKMLRCLLPLAFRVCTVTPQSPRALPGEALCREARKYHEHVTCKDTAAEALKWALEEARGIGEASKREGTGQQAMILAFGSLFGLGILKQEILAMGFADKEKVEAMDVGRQRESGSDELW